MFGLRFRRAILLLVTFTGIPAASAGPYEGYMSALVEGCPTFGPSTQEALGMIGRTRQLLDELARDPNCQGIAGTVNTLGILQAQLGSTTGPIGSASLAQSVLEAQRKVDELTLLASTVPPARATNEYMVQISNSLAQARVQLALATAATQTAGSSYSQSVRQFGTLPEIQRALLDIGAGLPALERCAQRRPELFSEVVGTLLPAVAALGSPAFGVAAATGGPLIKQLAEYFSQSKYSSSIRKLESLKQMAAVGCAIEHIQFSRCSARDGIALIDWQSRGQTTPPAVDSNWRGYNLLTVYLPTLTDWIQALQSGQTPQRTEDASYNADTDRILVFYNNAKDNIQALISEAKIDVAKDSDQRNIGLELLQRVYNYLTGAGVSAPKINVFLRMKTSADLPFFLVGKQPDDLAIPNISFGSSLSQVLDSRNRDKLPSNLVDVISEQFSFLLRGGSGIPEGGAEKILGDVLSRRRTDDAENLMAQVIIPREAGRSPYDVLQGLQRWLGDFLRIPEESIAATFKTTLSDGRSQAKRTQQLARSTFDVINDILRSVDDTGATPAEQISAISMRLNILRSRDRYLVERISNLVRVQLRAEVNSSRTEREIRAIFDSSKNDVYQKLIAYGTRSRQDVYDDLGTAAHFDTLHLDVIMDSFTKEIRKSLKATGNSHMRDLMCARLLAMPSIDRDLAAECAKSSLDSIYLSQSNLDPSWKKKLRLSFSDFAQLPYEERACAYRDFRRATYLFEDISGIGRRQNLPGSRY